MREDLRYLCKVLEKRRNARKINAITIKDDLKYYNALIDTKKCVDCGLCTKVCPRENDNDIWR